MESRICIVSDEHQSWMYNCCNGIIVVRTRSQKPSEQFWWNSYAICLLKACSFLNRGTVHYRTLVALSAWHLRWYRHCLKNQTGGNEQFRCIGGSHHLLQAEPQHPPGIGPTPLRPPVHTMRLEKQRKGFEGSRNIVFRLSGKEENMSGNTSRRTYFAHR